MNDSQRAACWLAAIAGASSLAFAALTVAVARGQTSSWDRRAKRLITSWSDEHSRSREVARVAAPVGTWWSQLGGSVVAAARLLASGRPTAALAIASSSLGAIALAPALERLAPLRRPPREHPERNDLSKQSYPSGHALRTSATAVTTSYVLWREGSAPWAGVPVTLSSLLTVGGKFVLSRHWSTDLLGGYFAGVAWGAACASVYELARD